MQHLLLKYNLNKITTNATHTQTHIYTYIYSNLNENIGRIDRIWTELNADQSWGKKLLDPERNFTMKQAMCPILKFIEINVYD